MVNGFIVAAILVAFLFWESYLVLAAIFISRGRSKTLFLRYEDKAVDLIFLMFACYRNFRLHLENKLEGDLPPRYLVVSNHQSLLDIIAIMRVLPRGRRARFVAKKELGKWIPLISMFLRTQGHCLVKRKGDPMHAMQAIAGMAERCRKEGTCPVIFPEGTRSRTGALGTFHSAGYRKLLEVESLPILVVAIEGGWRVATLKGFFKYFGTTSYSIRFVEVLSAPKGKKEMLATLETARRSIESALDSMK
jgi:1-acyl-sn-glycerol-3-phosphate acyltransferase